MNHHRSHRVAQRAQLQEQLEPNLNQQEFVLSHAWPNRILIMVVMVRMPAFLYPCRPNLC